MSRSPRASRWTTKPRMCWISSAITPTGCSWDLLRLTLPGHTASKQCFHFVDWSVTGMLCQWKALAWVAGCWTQSDHPDHRQRLLQTRGLQDKWWWARVLLRNARHPSQIQPRVRYEINVESMTFGDGIRVQLTVANFWYWRRMWYKRLGPLQNVLKSYW